MSAMLRIEPVGVAFDGYGRPGNQAAAADVLRNEGLDAALAAHEVMVGNELTLPPGTRERGGGTSFVNEPALLAMVDQVGARVRDAVAAGRLPLVYGGDCTTLLGTVPALSSDRPLGLLFVDGHEDTMPLDVSEDGEAANCEIGLLLGITGHLMRGPLASGCVTSPSSPLPRIAGDGRRSTTCGERALGGGSTSTSTSSTPWSSAPRGCPASATSQEA